MAKSAVLVAGLALCSVIGCNGPLPFLSGGRLHGEVRPAPASWAFPEDFGVIQLETDPEDPYSVNIAYTQLDSRLYVYAGDTKTRWVQNMEADPRVRFRIGEVIYELEAERVTDDAESNAFARAWVDHSVFHRDPATLDERWLYRLVARTRD